MIVFENIGVKILVHDFKFAFNRVALYFNTLYFDDNIRLIFYTRRPAKFGIFSAFRTRVETLRSSNLNEKNVCKICEIASKHKTFQFIFPKIPKFWQDKIIF